MGAAAHTGDAGPGRGCAPEHVRQAGQKEQGYLHEQVGQEAAQRLEGHLDCLQLFPRGQEVETGQERVHAQGLSSQLLVQPQQIQTRCPP